MTNEFSTTQFAFEKKSGAFYADGSDLIDSDYQHGIDITLRSQWTGSARTFFYVGPLKDVEGEVVAWEYKHPSGMSITVGND